MKEQSIENQTRMYLFDLMNTAKEHGFKADDTWELSLVTTSEMSKLERAYYPTITMKTLPETLLQMFYSIKTRLNQSLNKDEQMLDNRTVLSDELSYIVAYNPKRQRH